MCLSPWSLYACTRSPLINAKCQSMPINADQNYILDFNGNQYRSMPINDFQYLIGIDWNWELRIENYDQYWALIGGALLFIDMILFFLIMLICVCLFIKRNSQGKSFTLKITLKFGCSQLRYLGIIMMDSLAVFNLLLESKVADFKVKWKALQPPRLETNWKHDHSSLGWTFTHLLRRNKQLGEYWCSNVHMQFTAHLK